MALLLALVLHAALLLQLPRPDRGGARAEGAGGVTIALAPAGGRPGQAPESEPEQTTNRPEPEPQTESQRQREPKAEPKSQPESVHEPKPKPEPRAPEPAPEPEREPERDERLIEREPPQDAPELPSDAPQESAESSSPEAPKDRPSQSDPPRPEEHEAATQAGNDPLAGGGGGDQAGHRDGQAGGGDPGARADYLDQVKAQLQRSKQYPRRAERRRIEGRVALRFTIHADGRVTNAELVDGSGAQVLDRAAMDMLQRAQPLPPFPDDLERERITLTVPVAFSLR